jgi:hypothetical protein
VRGSTSTSTAVAAMAPATTRASAAARAPAAAPRGTPGGERAPTAASAGVAGEEEKNKRLAPRRAREQAKREQAQRKQEKDLAAASAPKSKKKATKLGKAQQELGAQQRQAKAKASGGAPKDTQESFLLEPSKELALPDTPRLALPAAEPAPAVPRLSAVLAQTALPALGPLQVACSSTIKGYPDSAYVQVKHVREPIFHGKGGRLDGCDGGGGKGGRRGK